MPEKTILLLFVTQNVKETECNDTNRLHNKAENLTPHIKYELKEVPTYSSMTKEISSTRILKRGRMSKISPIKKHQGVSSSVTPL